MTTAPTRPRTATPTGVIVAPPDLDRETWLAARRRGIGGSDIAAILGMDPYRSPLEVFLDKLDERPDIPRSAELSEAAAWGHRLEPVVAAAFAERTGLRPVPAPGMLAHVERRWMLANVDRLLAEEDQGELSLAGLLEIKTRSAYQLDEWADGVPDAPALQTHWYLAVTGLPRAYVAALIGGQRLIVHQVERDDDLAAHLVQIAGDFWQRVQHREPPPADGSPATAELLAHLYDVTPDAVTVADPADVLPLVEERRALKEREKQLAAELADVETRLKAAAGAAEVVKARGEVAFTWKQNGRFATRRFAEAHPELAAQYTRTVEALDVERLAAERPDLYRAFRARRLHIPAPKGTP
jgi:putative phage-type endonuclease